LKETPEQIVSVEIWTMVIAPEIGINTLLRLKISKTNLSEKQIVVGRDSSRGWNETTRYDLWDPD
jgi:hypothetical protein